MLKRKIYEDLVKWKNDDRKKSLLVRGARQVGKTYAINEFAKSNYESYLYINFEENPSYKLIFENDKDVDSIIRRMSLVFPEVEFIPGNTIIFLDEIQSCPDARVAFKFFTLDGRYDVIGSGSLLGVHYKEVSSYPAGYEDVIDMRSLDFEEFLWAMDVKDDVIGYIRSCLKNKVSIDEFTLKKFNEYLTWYTIVGGMPEAVSIFKETNHFGKVLKVQRSIVNSYLDDITKYATGLDKNRVRASFFSIPNQLTKQNKKFVYADVEGRKDSRYDTYGSSLSWLYDAGIIDFCYNLQEPVLPLASHRRLNVFKIYLKDTGLLMSMMEEGVAAAVLDGSLGINKGAIIENLVAEMISKNGRPLTYFERRGTLEIDFVLNMGGRIAAIEVKSGNNRQSKSLDVIMSDMYRVDRGIKMEPTNVHTDDNGIEHYPIFAAAFLDSL